MQTADNNKQNSNQKDLDSYRQAVSVAYDYAKQQAEKKKKNEVDSSNEQ
jgi:hypothetical protein